MTTEEVPPPTIAIDDLVDPRFPPEMVDAMAAMEPMAEAIEFTPEAVLGQAVEETGLDDFGDDLHVEPLPVFCRAIEEEAQLHPLGRVTTFSTMVAFARNKLLIADLLRRHPEIHDIEIRRPIVIAGQGRTGTTHLHNLIASDPALRSLPYWESVEPVPPLAEQGTTFDVDPRYTRCAENLAGLNFALPHFRRMHDMYPEHVHEELQLLAITFGGMLLDTMISAPMWRDYYLATEQRPYYEYMRTVLKVLTFLGGGERWVLKSPQHVEQIDALMHTFPDAIVICTHRDPVAVTLSGITMLTYTSRNSARSEHLVDVGRYWSDRFERMFRAMSEQRHLLPASQSMDVPFHEFMADDIATVERIYEFADQPFTADVRAAMEAFMVEHPRGKYGRLRYSFAPFDIDRAERRRALQFYVDRFDVELEGD